MTVEMPPAERPSTLKGGPLSERVIALFARGEAFDHDGFADLFTEDAVYAFGNYPVCRTHADIANSTKAFFAQVQALYHGVRSLTEVETTVFVEMDVVYWRHDGSHVELPCADIVRFRGDQVAELRIFMDANPIGTPASAPDPSASVLTQRGGVREPLPGTMRNFFAKTAEGHARVASGYAPKWAIAGPHWPLRAAGR